VDCGTEFGVLVDGRGDSEVHICDGRVRVEATRADKEAERFRELAEGRSVRVDRTGAIRTRSLNERLFYRSVPDVPSFGIPGRRLDLADILGAGNGFGTGQMSCAINPLTGRYSTFDRQNYVKYSRGHYVPVQQNDFVDGVFIPDRGRYPAVVVSSRGDVFQDCPVTKGSGDGEIQNTHRTILFHSGEMSCVPRLGDRVFDTPAHPHIYLQANIGITFDLDAIRNRLTGNCIRRFVAECGVCTEIPVKKEEVDFWVLVDGKVRFSKRDATNADGAIEVAVPLHEQDRFLTLAVTEGTDGSSWDLALFAEPALELGSKNGKVE